MRKSENENSYPFAWMDEVIEVTMNPQLTTITLLKPSLLEEIIQRFAAEARQIFSSLKSQTFCLLSSDKTRIAVEEYHTQVLQLAVQAKFNLEANVQNDLWVKTGRLIIDELDTLCVSIQKRYRKYLPKINNEGPEEINDLRTMLFKVLLSLSVDQIGIILKSAYNVKVILSSSYRKVCKAITPYLSTQRYETISDSGVRNSYCCPEKRDREIAVETLQKIIRDIEGK
jgi:hypothetical protein